MSTLNILDLQNHRCFPSLLRPLITCSIEDVCPNYRSHPTLLRRSRRQWIRRLSFAFIGHRTIPSITCTCMPFRSPIGLGGTVSCLLRPFLGMDRWRAFCIVSLLRTPNCDFSPLRFFSIQLREMVSTAIRTGSDRHPKFKSISLLSLQMQHTRHTLLLLIHRRSFGTIFT